MQGALLFFFRPLSVSTAPHSPRWGAAGSADIEAAVAFLEANPWFFRSGYVKANLIRWLICASVGLAPEQVERLARVVVGAVDARDRREFRRYCRLARKVASPELRGAEAPSCSGSSTPIRASGAAHAGSSRACRTLVGRSARRRRRWHRHSRSRHASWRDLPQARPGPRRREEDRYGRH